MVKLVPFLIETMELELTHVFFALVRRWFIHKSAVTFCHGHGCLPSHCSVL